MGTLFLPAFQSADAHVSAEEEEYPQVVEMSKKEKRRQDLLDRLDRLQRDFAEHKEK